MATLIKSCNAEDNWDSIWDFAPSICPIVPGVSPYSYSFQINTNPAFVGSGTKSYRIEERNRDYACNGNARAEMIYIQDDSPSGPISRFNIEIWSGFTIIIPSDYPFFPAEKPGKIVFQYQHGSPELHAIVYQDANPLTFRWFLNHRTASSQTKVSNSIGVPLTLTRGARHDIICRHVRRLDANGIIQVWVDGTLGWTYNGYSAFDGDFNDRTNICQFKNGLYGGDLFDGVSYVMYYDNFKVAVGSDGYSLVDPSGGGGGPTFSVDAGGPYTGEVDVPVQLTSTVTEA